MGVLAAAAAAMLLTGVRRIFVSPGEVERGLRLPVLASFPRVGKPFDVASMDPAVAGLAALLLDMAPNGALGHHVQVVQLVATDAQDGRDRLARVLAVELARAHGRRVLLCDLSADGRAHLADLGVAHAQMQPSDGGIDAFGTVIRQAVDHLRRAAIRAGGPAYACRPMWSRCWASCAKTFDVILLVGPALVETYAQRRLAALVDANLVVVRAERTEGARAWTLRETILGSGGNLLGAVLTGQREVVPAPLRRALA